jgi:hypothetical protein
MCLEFSYYWKKYRKFPKQNLQETEIRIWRLAMRSSKNAKKTPMLITGIHRLPKTKAKERTSGKKRKP